MNRAKRYVDAVTVFDYWIHWHIGDTEQGETYIPYVSQLFPGTLKQQTLKYLWL